MTSRLPRTGLLALLLLAACGESGTGTSEPSSFNRIQTEIFDAQCVSCHTSGTRDAKESGLVLDRKQSFEALVGAQPTLAAARSDGMLRVAAGDPDRSLLLHKLHWETSHHGSAYGAPMPLGGKSLSVGQIEFVRQWILAGAPRAGEVADPKLLEDRTAPSQETFTPLAPPTQGYQLKVGPFQVRPNFERELFVHRSLGNPQDIYVTRIETKMRANSHHLLLYTFKPGTPTTAIPPFDVLRDIRNADGSLNFLNMIPMGYHVFFGGSMVQLGDYRLPDGVALRLPANASIDLNSHYVNRTTAELTGEAYANLYTVDASRVEHVARTLNLANTSFSLPPRQRTTVTKTFMAGSADLPLAADGTVHVLMLTSHMHARGERFVIRIAGGARNGEVIYTSTDWEHPAMLTLTPVLVLRQGEGLTSEVTYNNTSDQTVSFGLSSTDEMDIIFGYAY